MEASFRIFFSLLEVGSIQCLNFTFRAPDYFNEGWMAKIKLDEVTNWRLKVHVCKDIICESITVLYTRKEMFGSFRRSRK